MNDIGSIHQSLTIQAGRAGRRRRIREIAAFLVVTLCLTPLLVALVSLLATASR